MAVVLIKLEGAFDGAWEAEDLLADLLVDLLTDLLELVVVAVNGAQKMTVDITMVVTTC